MQITKSNIKAVRCDNSCTAAIESVYSFPLSLAVKTALVMIRTYDVKSSTN